MFVHNFKYIFKVLFKNKGLIFWTFVFPIALGLLFNLAFRDIEKNEKLSRLNLGVVGSLDDYYKSAFDSLDGDTFNVSYISLDEAMVMLDDGTLDGFVSYDEDFSITVKNSGINQTIIKYVVDKIDINKALVLDMVSAAKLKNDHRDVSLVYDDINSRIDINDVSSSHLSFTMIEYYTLIAMACLYGGILSMYAINVTLPNLSSKGKRVTVSPVLSRVTVISSLCASFVASLIGLFLLFMFTIFVIKVDYGSRLFNVIILAVVGALSGLSLGLFVGVNVKGSESVKTSILIAVTMFFSFLSGMMGITMKYIVDTHVPFLNKINPCSLITDGLYSLYYYSSLSRYYGDLVCLFIFALVLIILSCISLRRKTYDNI